MKHSLRVLNLDLEPYDHALELQHRLVAARRDGRVGDTLILLEHPPVITLGRRGNEDNVLVSRQWLAAHGLQVRRVERGGDVTYHGPGQLVGYPIVDLRQHRQDVAWYVHSLEEVLIRTLLDFGVVAKRLPGNVGVWLDERRKIASLGVRIESWITYHGFALNVSPDLSHFDLVVPCGLVGKEVTSMEEALGREVEMSDIRSQVAQNFATIFGLRIGKPDGTDLSLLLEAGREPRSTVRHRAAV